MEGRDEDLGFFTTLYIQASRASEATNRAGIILLDRLAVEEIRPVEYGAFKSLCYAKDIWEMEAGFSPDPNLARSGFVLYKIGMFLRAKIFIYKLFLLTRKQPLLIDLAHYAGSV